MSHLATADSDPDFARDADRALPRGDGAVLGPDAALREQRRRAAASRTSRFDAARCGVALYGLSPFGERPGGRRPRARALVASHLAQVRQLAPGESTGYGRRFVAEEPTWIGIVPVGYADGFRRDLTGTEVRVDGEPRRVVGTVSMDAFAVELERELPAGTPVTILGHGVLAEDHARVAGTINYELVRGSTPIPRAGAEGGRRCVSSSRSCSPARRPGSSAARFATSRSVGRSSTSTSRSASRSAPRARYAKRSGGAPFPLSERHGAWRVALDGGRTVDFTPLPGSIEDDLATPRLQHQRHRGAGRQRRDRRPVRRPRRSRGAAHPRGRRLGLPGRPASAAASRAPRGRARVPARCARPRSSCAATRALVTAPAGERSSPSSAALGRRLPAARRARAAGAARRLELDERLDRVGLACVPPGRRLRRAAAALSGLERPAPPRVGAAAGGAAGARTPRSIHRFRRATEPWALEALAFVGAPELGEAVEEARRNDPRSRCLRGDELGLPPGPEIGRLLEEIDEERAAGTIATKEEALDVCTTPRRSGSPRRLSGSPRFRTRAPRSWRRRSSALPSSEATSARWTAPRVREPSRSHWRRTCARSSRWIASRSCSSKGGSARRASTNVDLRRGRRDEAAVRALLVRLRRDPPLVAPHCAPRACGRGADAGDAAAAAACSSSTSWRRSTRSPRPS